ncbi:DTW domain-containing protein [Alteromonas sp. 345S023]|uniref:tRNA-uridine aminocarboxypropyltransferase n=1 Tax=Alteromonas profundi TaxID=2696062 RepID=A0A7X5RKW8_9ALTE|nr:tRNA-uridine aminocarboxypropyltransferase [Alteromonas profundi]NDV90855.1 DTW domain-containing protein [Alteromonas profundi]
MRQYCNRCSYPQKTCVCKHVTKVTLPIEVVIIQHPKEAAHAKNTARLIGLSTAQARIVNAADTEQMAQLKACLQPYASILLYPNDGSEALEAVEKQTRARLQQLFVIDGSWKQAYGIVKQHTWLQSIPAYHFLHAPSTRYRIRHTDIEQGLSTLEASAYAMHCLYGIDTGPFIRLQAAMQDNWLGPSHHQRKTVK